MAHPKPTIDINAFDELPDDLVITEADVALLFGQPLIERLGVFIALQRSGIIASIVRNLPPTGDN